MIDLIISVIGSGIIAVIISLWMIRRNEKQSTKKEEAKESRIPLADIFRNTDKELREWFEMSGFPTQNYWFHKGKFIPQDEFMAEAEKDREEELQRIKGMQGRPNPLRPEPLEQYFYNNLKKFQEEAEKIYSKVNGYAHPDPLADCKPKSTLEQMQKEQIAVLKNHVGKLEAENKSLQNKVDYYELRNCDPATHHYRIMLPSGDIVSKSYTAFLLLCGLLEDIIKENPKGVIFKKCKDGIKFATQGMSLCSQFSNSEGVDYWINLLNEEEKETK